jgi:biotin-(acetyl-CoA carboxylase) ligase
MKSILSNGLNNLKNNKIMKKLLKTWRVKLLAFLTPEPEMKEEYVAKVVYLLRRDFTTTEQNEIIQSITKKLSDLRELDMTEMALNYERLQKDAIKLRSAIVF